jgi:hypothetical protein
MLVGASLMSWERCHAVATLGQRERSTAELRKLDELSLHPSILEDDALPLEVADCAKGNAKGVEDSGAAEGAPVHHS